MALEKLNLFMHRKEKNTNLSSLLFIGLMGIIAFSLIVWITPLGAGVTPDSIAYLRGAQNLIDGKGFSLDNQPITHYPPMYSFFLAASSLLDKDLVQAARFLNAILFAVNVGLVAAVVYCAAGQNFLVTLLAVVFLLTTTPLIEIHITALAEPLFIAFFLAGIILLSLYVVKPTPFLLIASSLCFGLLPVTRYIGAFFLPLAWVIVFFFSYKRAIRQQSNRFRDALIWFLLSLAPLGLLIVRNTIVAGSSTGRSLVIHPLSVSIFVDDVLRTMVGFVTPVPILRGVGLATLNMLFVILVTLLIVFFVVFIKRYTPSLDWRSFEFVVGVFCLAFSINYLLGLFFSKTFVDAATPVDIRIMSPIFLPLVIWVFSTTWLVSGTLNKPVVMWGFLFLLVLVMISKTPKSIHALVGFQKNGLYYTSRQWQESETIKFIKSLPEGVRIYSNAPDPIGFLTEKQSQILPYKENITTRIKNPRYDDEVQAMCEDVRENRAIVVYFKGMERSYLTTRKDLEAACPVSVLRRFPDGIIYAR